jgi:hypothetical protein
LEFKHRYPVFCLVIGGRISGLCEIVSARDAATAQQLNTFELQAKKV